MIPRLNATAINNSRTQTSITEPPIKSKSSRTGINWGVLTRRLFVVITMQGLGWGSVLYSIRGVPPPCHDQWDGEICIQTDDSTCSAACAATILKAHGIETTESEMASFCLTRKGGTLWQGLYRGLKLKTAGTAWDVAIISGSLETLRSIETKAAILAVGIPKGELVPPIYTEQYGWTPGVLHSVLFFGFREQGLVSMGEPTPGVGKENWSEEDLRILWRGRGMTLIARE